MRNFILIIFISLIISGCAESNSYSSSVSSQQESFILVKGGIEGKTLFINTGQVNLSKVKKFEIDGIQNAKFPVQSGNVLLKVMDNNKVIYLKKTFISKGQTYEVILH